ncbi:MAG: YggU family protein [Nanoarchaeota archaeon]|nr:YggU family protein [Nanoarchaeota archaeon]
MIPKDASGIKVIIRPNSKKAEFLGFDEARQAYRVAVKAEPEKGKANAELLKFLKKSTGRDARIVSGKTARSKIIRFDD